MEIRENETASPLLDNNVNNENKKSSKDNLDINEKICAEAELKVKINENDESLKMENCIESLSQEKIPYLKVIRLLRIVQVLFFKVTSQILDSFS